MKYVHLHAPLEAKCAKGGGRERFGPECVFEVKETWGDKLDLVCVAPPSASRGESMGLLHVPVALVAALPDLPSRKCRICRCMRPNHQFNGSAVCLGCLDRLELQKAKRCWKNT